MPILQWFLLFLLSLLISLIFLWLHLPAAMLLGPMIAGIVLSLRGSSLQLPRGIFLAAQAILGCMIAQNLTGSILTTLALYWPVVLLVLLVTLLSSAIVGWLLVRYSLLPGNTGAWGSSPGGAAAMVAMAQDYGADIRLVAFMQYLRVLFVAGAAVLVTRLILGDSAAAVSQQLVWFPPLSGNLLTTLLLAIVAGIAGRLMRIPLPARCCSPCWQARFSIRTASLRLNYPNGCWPWPIWRLAGVSGWASTDRYFLWRCGHCRKSYFQFSC